MDQKQNNWLRMYNVVDEYGNENNAKFEGYTDLLNCYLEFRTLKASLNTKISNQNLELKGITEQKVVLKEELKSLAIRLSIGVSVWATSTDNLKLKGEMKISDSYFHSKPELVLVQFVEHLEKVVTENINALAAYKILPADLSLLSNKYAEFKKVISHPKIARNDRHGTTGEIKVLFKQINHLLADKLDIMMRLYEFSDPELYHRYKIARAIDDLGRRKKKTKETTPGTAEGENSGTGAGGVS